MNMKTDGTFSIPTVCSNKVGCAFPMVILSDFRMKKHKDDDHEEDAPYFRRYVRYGCSHCSTHLMNRSETYLLLVLFLTFWQLLLGIRWALSIRYFIISFDRSVHRSFGYCQRQVYLGGKFKGIKIFKGSSKGFFRTKPLFWIISVKFYGPEILKITVLVVHRLKWVQKCAFCRSDPSLRLETFHKSQK